MRFDTFEVFISSMKQLLSKSYVISDSQFTSYNNISDSRRALLIINFKWVLIVFNFENRLHMILM